MANTDNRGFGSMDDNKQRDIASKGGKSVPDEKRSFSQDRELASEAGRRGGENSHGGQQQASGSERGQQNDQSSRGGSGNSQMTAGGPPRPDARAARAEVSPRGGLQQSPSHPFAHAPAA